MEQGWDTEIKSEANSSPLSSNATLVEDGSPGPKQTAWVDGTLQEEAYWHDYPADTLLPCEPPFSLSNCKFGMHCVGTLLTLQPRLISRSMAHSGKALTSLSTSPRPTSPMTN